jgi:hypothetical protein
LGLVIHLMARRDNREFNKVKEVIKFILGYRCQLCHKVSMLNHLHHLDRNNQNNNPFNFVCLCESHHKMVHKLHVQITPILEPHQHAMLQELKDFMCIHTYKISIR